MLVMMAVFKQFQKLFLRGLYHGHICLAYWRRRACAYLWGIILITSVDTGRCIIVIVGKTVPWVGVLGYEES